MIKDIILKKDNLNIYLENEINDSLMEILRKRLSCIIRNFKILNITFFLKNIDEADLINLTIFLINTQILIFPL